MSKKVFSYFKTIFISIILVVGLLLLFTTDFNKSNDEKYSYEENGITIEGVDSGLTLSKPKIMFYVSNKNIYYKYNIIIENDDDIELVLKNVLLDINNLFVDNNQWYLDNYCLNISDSKNITKVELVSQESTKIVSATLNGVDFNTNTTLAYSYGNGEYSLVVTDSENRVARVVFVLNNNSYIKDVSLSLLEGVKITLKVFAITLLFSIPLGLIGAMLKKINCCPFFFLSNNKSIFLQKIAKFNPLKLVLNLYTLVIRGTPLLLQLFVINFGIPIAFGSKYNLGALYACYVTFIINYTAYFIEIFRGGMETIKKGQFEACEVLGFSKIQMYSKIILPQTFKKVIPSITNEAITLVKDTALVASVALADLLFITKQKVSLDFRIDAYAVAAVMYLAMTLVIVWIFNKIEKKYSFYN